MRSRLHYSAALFVVMLLGVPAFPQNERAQTPAAAAPTVTVSVTSAGVRFVAHGAVTRMRVEVLGADGTPLGAHAFKPGSVFDWSPSADGAGPLADGDYQIVVTIVDAAGRMSLKQCAVVVTGGAAALRLGEAAPAGEAEPEKAAAESAAAMTLTAHDGRAGQLVTTAGDLSFRGGDFFTGRDRELMRLSADGSLDVSGQLRARRGIRFNDGTVLESARGLAGGKGGKGAKAAAGGGDVITPAAAGTGTLNRLAKWAETGGAGTLTNSAVTEAGGFVGINNPNPGAGLDVAGSFRATGTNTVPTGAAGDGVEMWYWTGPGGPYGLLLSYNRGTSTYKPLWLAGNYISFQQGATERMRVAENGNVGIGTASPLARLDVNGAARFTPGGSGGAIQFGTPGGTETGMTISNGTGRGELRFNGSTLKLVAGPDVGPPSAASGVAVTTAGNVGVGTDAPSVGKLHVIGGPGQPAIYGESANRGVWGRSTGSSRGVVGESVGGEGVLGTSTSGIGVAGGSTSNIGVRGETASIIAPGVHGVSTGGGVGVRGDGTTGVYGYSANSGGAGVSGEANENGSRGVSGSSKSATGFGVFAENPAGMALGVAGNAVQNRDKGGLVKAMIHVNADGTVRHCYNSQMQDGGASLPPSGFTGCGFSVSRAFDDSDANRGTVVAFNFQVNDRFWSATPVEASIDNVGLSTYNDGANQIVVNMFFTDERTGTRIYRNFMLIVY